MTRILYLILISFGLIRCNNINSKKKLERTENIVSDVEGKTAVETAASYETLKNLLINNQPIYGDYLLTDSKEPLRGSLNDHSILQETNDYIFVQSTNGGTSVSQYYLVSFSKKTGVLIDFIRAGTEAEGVDPFKVNWKSNTSFSTVDYQYELLEDEESGAYMKGALLDSTVHHYDIASSGLIIYKD